MAEPNPATWTAVAPTAATFNTNIRDALQWVLGHSTNPKPHLRVRSTVATSLTSGTFTAISFDTVVKNRGFAWVNGTTATIPVAGTYLVGCSVEINAAACNKALRITQNAATVIAEHDITGVGSSAVARITIATLKDFALNDTVKIEGFQDSGAGLNANSAGEFSPVMWVAYYATAN